MLIDVDKLIFKKLENKIVYNLHFANIINTSYPQDYESYILLKDKDLGCVIYSYNHIHNTYYIY